MFLVVLPFVCAAQNILLIENFEDTNYSLRGWYDGEGPPITETEHIPGSARSAEFRFLQGATKPVSGGAIRYLFPETGSVYLRYWVKYSQNWEGSNKPYHPHEFNFISNVDGMYIGPAATHLTTYIEQNEGTPLLTIQDALNIDESRIGEELRDLTEMRAVAGCNGTSDRYPIGDCYWSGSQHRNGKVWKAPFIAFSDSIGKYDKNTWHKVEAYFKLNDIVNGKGVANGIVRYWLDGDVLIDAPDVMLRTGQHTAMAFNQFLMAPYIGDGSPVEQIMWVDNLMIATDRLMTPVENIPIAHPNSMPSLTVFPNPFSDHFTVHPFPTERSLAFKVYDIFGKEVTNQFTKEENFLTEGSTLYLRSPLPEGIYLLRYQTKTFTVVNLMFLSLR